MSSAAGPPSVSPQENPDHYTAFPALPAEAAAGAVPDRGAWRAVCGRGFAICLLYIGAAIYFTWPLVPQFRTHTVAHFDAPFSAWRLAWVARQLVLDPSTLFDTNVFWPARDTLAYSDAVLVQGLLAMPLLHSGLSPIAAMNVLTVLGMVASGVGAYVLARRLTGHTGAGLLAGMTFAFAPYRHDHLAHLEMQWAQWMPLALWAWHRALDRGRLLDGLLTGVFALLQLLSSIYYGIFLGATLAVLGTITLAQRRFRIPRQALAGLVAGAIVLGLGAAEYSRPYRRAQAQLGDRDPVETRRYSATLSSFVSTHPDNRVYGRFIGYWNDEERRLFPGLTPVLLAGVALAPPVTATAVAYAAATLFAVDASLGLNGVVFRLLREHVAVFRGFRAPARFGVLVLLGLSVLGAIGLASAVRRWPRHARALPVAALALVTLEYSVEPVSLMAMPASPPRMYRWLAATQLPGTVVLEVPVPRANLLPFEDPIFMYASTWHWRPLINGYSGYYYRPYIALLGSMERFPDATAVAALARAGAQIVIVHKALFRRSRYEKVVAELEVHPRFRLLMIADDWASEARAYAYLPNYTRISESDE